MIRTRILAAFLVLAGLATLAAAVEAPADFAGAKALAAAQNKPLVLDFMTDW